MSEDTKLDCSDVTALTLVETPSGRDPETGRFLTGNNGSPGRPLGARNRLREAFLTALEDSFKAHGTVTIEASRIEKPTEFLKIIASVLPKDVEISGGEGGPIVLTWLKAQA